MLFAVGLDSVVTVLEPPAELAWLVAGVLAAGVALDCDACEALEAGVLELAAEDDELAGVEEAAADELGVSPAPLSGGVILTLQRQQSGTH